MLNKKQLKKELKKELKKAKKYLNDLDNKEEKKRIKWHKYIEPNCDLCNGKGYILGDYGDDLSYHKIRCQCSKIYTERYKKHLNKFYDNNVDCNSYHIYSKGF